MIALPTAAIECERLTAVTASNVAQALRNLADSGIPVYSFKAAVASLSKRRGEAIGMILIIVEPLRLLTRVASGGRMRAVAANLHDLPPLGHRLDAAVDVAEAACRRMPLVFGRYCGHGNTPWRYQICNGAYE